MIARIRVWLFNVREAQRNAERLAGAERQLEEAPTQADLKEAYDDGWRDALAEHGVRSYL